MSKSIEIGGNSVQDSVPVRRRNPHGSEVELVSTSLPKELAQKINGIVVETKQSRSRVISELIADGLAKRESNG